MAFTGQEIMDMVEFLGDDATNVDFPEADAPRFFTECLTRIYSSRPDAARQLDGTREAFAEITDLVTDIPLDLKWKQLFVDWYLYKGYASDARDQQDLKQA